MAPKHDGARPHIPKKRKRIPLRIPCPGAPYPCMLPKTWSTTGVLDRFSLPKDHWNYPIKREEQEPLPLPDYFYPITGGIKKNFAKKKNSDGIDMSNIIPCSSDVQRNMRVTRRMLSNSVVVKVDLCQKLLFLHQLTHNMKTYCSLNYKFNA